MLLIYAGPVGMDAAPLPPAGRDVISEVLATMREHGGRATSARRLLLEVLVRTPGHHSADQLAAQVQARVPEVNKSTIYRNLEELERLQVVDRTYCGHGPATYHLAAAGHGHLVCDSCGSMTEIPDTIFDTLGQAAHATYGFTIEPRKSAIIGRCIRCARAGGPECPADDGGERRLS